MITKPETTMNSQVILNTLFDLKRQQVALAYLNPATEKFVDKAYAYAISNKVYPFLHDPEDHFFDDFYAIKREFVEDILIYADDLFLKDKYLTFYEYESIFGHDKRCELLFVFRYAFLCRNRFNDKFYETLISEAPSEASLLSGTFNKDEITLF